MTELLFFSDCYASQFSATVAASEGQKCELDRTAFYPEGGGQPSDTGILKWGGMEARVDRVCKEGPRVIHELAAPAPAIGKEVYGILDWDRRYAHMRYHTAQHLLSAHFLQAHGASTTGNQISMEKATIDFDIPALTREIVEQAERQVLSWVEESIPVIIRTLPREEALRVLDPARTRVDRLPRSLGTLRIVEIAGVDTVACGGTHVGSTREVGGIRVTGIQSKGTGRKRIEFVLG